MATSHHSVIGNPVSLTTLKVKTVLLLYSKTKGSGTTCVATANAILFVVGVSGVFQVFSVSKVIS